MDRPIRIVIINGSVRKGNYTAMASALVADELRKDPRISVEVINPAELGLPFPGVDPNSPATKRLQETVKNATAVVLVTPEYHGSFSSVMKLVIENLGFPSVLAGKPVALVGQEGHVLDPQVEQRLRGAATQLIDYLNHAVCPRVTLEALMRGAAA